MFKAKRPKGRSRFQHPWQIFKFNKIDYQISIMFRLHFGETRATDQQTSGKFTNEAHTEVTYHVFSCARKMRALSGVFAQRTSRKYALAVAEALRLDHSVGDSPKRNHLSFWN